MLQSSEVHLEKVVLPSGTVKAGVRLENGLIVALSEKHLEQMKDLIGFWSQWKKSWE